ncbi:MAG: hypothetical protein H0V17_19015 [Deltaproteobacteria bacterium]|nr:hypothetical protein [Deltaproteobacteria bacterium]
MSGLALAVVACKGETVVKIDPTTQTALDNCKKDFEEQKKLIATLQEQNTQLQTKQTTAEIVVTIEGNALTVRPGKPGEPPRPIDDKAAATASKEFLDVVRKSRGAIQKCYEQALKKTTGLQSKTVTLTVSASFSPQGAYKNSSFAPSLGDTFDTCIRSVATKWVLPQNSPAMTFQAQVSLTPS